MPSRFAASPPKRLFRQPGGFEGFLPGLVLPVSHYPALFELIDAEHRHLGLDTARPAATAPVKDHDDRIACVDELQMLDDRVLPCSEPVDEEPLHTSMPFVHTGL